MAEEQQHQRWQDGHRLCANNCGFFGSPATLDLCSKCYRDLYQQQLLPAGPSAPAASAFQPSSSAVAASPEPEPPSAAAASAAGATAAGRCASCRKRVGLTGFACRCGVHRYPERHACAFDFRAAGRDAIARANPVVKGDKLKDKI